MRGIADINQKLSWRRIAETNIVNHKKSQRLIRILLELKNKFIKLVAKLQKEIL
jgi:hypothetical protein